jgi:hypothetical protein
MILESIKLSTMKYIYILLILDLYIMSLSTTCVKKVDKENTFCIENKFEYDLYIAVNYDYPKPSKTLYTKEMLQANLYCQVLAKDSSKIGLWGICQEQVWKRLVSSDTIQMLILNKDSVNSRVENSFAEYLENKQYIREYKLTYNDIIENGCKLIIK